MRIAVIGGGVGGLTAARALRDAGVDVVVLEAAVRAGGVIGTSHIDGYVREHAASSFLGGPTNGGRAMCDTLGVPVDKASPAAKQRWIYLDGKLRALPASPLAFARSDLLTWRGKLDILREPFRAGRGVADESMHAFAARRLGAEAARAIIAPFVTGVFAADAHDVSLEAGFPKFAALDAQGGLVRGMLKSAASGMIAKLRGHPVPSTPRGMWTPHGGMGALIDALVKDLGARVRLASRVESIAPVDRGVRIDGMPELEARLAGFVRSPVAIVYLGYPEASVPHATEGFGVLVAQGEDVRVLGVVFESVVWPERAPAGKALLRCIYGGGRDPEAARLDDAALIALAQRDLAKVLGATGAAEHASVVRWAHGLPQYPVGHRDKVAQATVVARGHRIALAGADYRGAGVNDLCADAEVVAREVLAWS